MGRGVVLALQAKRDLEGIVRYIARDNPVAAEKFRKNKGRKNKENMGVQVLVKVRALAGGAMALDRR